LFIFGFWFRYLFVTAAAPGARPMPATAIGDHLLNKRRACTFGIEAQPTPAGKCKMKAVNAFE
jgi:hypothetical protein